MPHVLLRTVTVVARLAHPSVSPATASTSAQALRLPSTDASTKSRTEKKAVAFLQISVTDNNRQSNKYTTYKTSCAHSAVSMRHLHNFLNLTTVSSFASVFSPTLAQRRFVTHRTPSNGKLTDTGAATPAAPPRRRFARRQGPAKRAVIGPADTSADQNSNCTTTTSSFTFAKPAGNPTRTEPETPAFQSGQQNGREGGMKSDILTDVEADRDDINSQGKTGGSFNTPRMRSPLSSSSDTFFDFRLPPEPTVDTATPASLCSYLLTLRRCVQANCAGNHTISLTARRTVNAFMSFGIPTLLQSPPGETGTSLLQEAAQLTTQDSDTAVGDGKKSMLNNGERYGSDYSSGNATKLTKGAAGKGFTHAATLRDQVGLLAGSGPVPWTAELAESILQTAALTDIAISQLWSGQAALKFLLQEWARGYASAKNGREAREKTDSGENVATDKSSHERASPFTSGAPHLQTVKMQRVMERARFAVAMLQAQEMVKRRAKFSNEILEPRCWRMLRHGLVKSSTQAAAKSPPPLLNSDVRSETLMTPTTTEDDLPFSNTTGEEEERSGSSDIMTSQLSLDASARQAVADLDVYLYACLLPSLFNDLRQLCAEVERRYDLATPTQPSFTAATSTRKSESSFGNVCKHTHIPAESSPSSPLLSELRKTLSEECLPLLSRNEQETFALLLSVLYRTLNVRGVAPIANIHEHTSVHDSSNSSRRSHCSEGFYFQPFLQAEGHQYVEDVVAAQLRTTPMEGLPLRAFTITLAAVALSMDRWAGPHTGLLEGTLHRWHENHDTYYAAFNGVEKGRCAGATADEEERRQFTCGGHVSDTKNVADAKFTRFTRPASALSSSSEAFATRFQRGNEVTEASSTLHAGKPKANRFQRSRARRCGTGRERGSATEKAPHLPAVNFNVEPLLSVLKFCNHEHALQLLINTADVCSRDKDGRIEQKATAPNGKMAEGQLALCASGEMLQDDYINQIAHAHLTLLQLSVHWAPLCRTAQLPAVVHAVARIFKRSRASVQRNYDCTPSTQDFHSGCRTALQGVAGNDTLFHTGRDNSAVGEGDGDGCSKADSVRSTTSFTMRAPKVAAAATVAGTLGSAVQDRVCQLFWCTYSNTTVVEHLIRRLLRSSLRYLEKQTPGTFVSTAVELDHIFAYWSSGLLADINGSNNENGAKAEDDAHRPVQRQRQTHRSNLCYPLAASSVPNVHLFNVFLENCWSRMLGQLFWSSIPFMGFSLSHGCQMRRKTLLAPTDARTPTFLARVRKSPAVRVYLFPDKLNGWSAAEKARIPELLTNVNSRRVTDGGGPLSSPSSFCPPSSTTNWFHTMPAPPFALSWLRNHVSGSVTAATPDIFVKLLRINDHVAHSLAMPGSGGRLNGAAALLREWRCTPYLHDALTGSDEAFFSTQEIRMHVAALRLPVLLSIDAEEKQRFLLRFQLSAAATGNEKKVSGDHSSFTSSSVLSTPVASRLSLRPLAPCTRISSKIIASWSTRINPLELYVTSTGRLCSSAALAQTGPSSHEKKDEADVSTKAAEQLRGSNASQSKQGTVTQLQKPRDPAFFWQPTWGESAFSLQDAAALLRWVHLMNVAEFHSALRPPSAHDTSVIESLHKTRQPKGSNTEEMAGLTPALQRWLEGFELPRGAWLSQAMEELLLRLSHRILFAPHDRAIVAAAATKASRQQKANSAFKNANVVDEKSTVDAAAVGQGGNDCYDDRVFAQDPAASLETLLTLYLALLTVVTYKGRSFSHQTHSTTNGTVSKSQDNNSGDRFHSTTLLSQGRQHQQLVVISPYQSQLVSTRSQYVMHLRNSLRYCAVQCEAALHDRLGTLSTEATSNGGKALFFRNAIWQSENENDDGEPTLEAAFHLALIVEAAWPRIAIAPGDSNTERDAGDEFTLPQQLQAVFYRQLQHRLRECSLRDIAALLSDQLWWTTQRQRVAALLAAMPATVSPCPSWVEETILDAVEEKLYGASVQRDAKESQLGTMKAHNVGIDAGTAHERQSFDVYEWTLLPLYARLEMRRQQRSAAKSNVILAARSAACSITAPASGVLDDFTSLEDAFAQSDGPGPAAAGYINAPFEFSGQSASAPSADERQLTFSLPMAGVDVAAYVPTKMQAALLLEKALNGLVLHCESFEALLHVVRYLFLSYPVTLTTAPNAALELSAYAACEATGSWTSTHTPSGSPLLSTEGKSTAAAVGVAFSVDGFNAQSSTAGSLPLQWVDIPQHLRQRYVDTLYRLFCRLVYLPCTSLDDIVEFLHVLWLADPGESRTSASSVVARQSGSSNEDIREQKKRYSSRSSRLSPGSLTTSQAWPSLYQLCAAFISEALRTDDQSYQGRTTGMNGSYGSKSAVPNVTVPPAIRALREAVESGILTTLGYDANDAAPSYTFVSVQLPPLSVLLFLQALAAQVRADRAAFADVSGVDNDNGVRGDSCHHRLTGPQRSLLDLLKPFVLYTIAVGEILFCISKATYMPTFLEVLSELDPQLVLTVIYAAFTGTGGSSKVHTRRQGSSIRGQRIYFPSGFEKHEEHARSVAATISAIVMLSNQAQASSAVWAATALSSDTTGPVTGSEELTDDGAAVTNEDDGDDELSSLRCSSSGKTGASIDGAPCAKSGKPAMVVGKAHQRALWYLTSELRFQLSVPARWQPLRLTEPSMLLQLMQLSSVRSHKKLFKSLTQLLLRVLTTSEVGTPSGRTADGTPEHLAPKFHQCSESVRGVRRADKVVGCINRNCGSAQRKPAAFVGNDTAQAALSPVGQLLLRQLPLWMWRELFYRYIKCATYMPYMRGFRLAASRKYRWRHLNPVTTFEVVCDRTRPSSTGKQRGGESNGEEDDATGEKAEDPAVPPNMTSLFVRENFSLATVLMSLDAESTRALTGTIMSPSVLFTLTADLLQRQWYSQCIHEEGPLIQSAVTLEGTATSDRRRGASLRDAGEKAAASFSLPSSSFAVLMRYASLNSVLRTPELQPYLIAACDTFDALASSNAAGFFAVLRREAAWKRQVENSTLSQRAAPTGFRGKETTSQQQQMTGMETESNATEERSNPLGKSYQDTEEVVGRLSSSSVPVWGADIAGSDDLSTVMERENYQDTNTTRSADHVAAVPEKKDETVSMNATPGLPDSLVLDWQPIVRFVRTLYIVDPCVMECQLREVWQQSQLRKVRVGSFEEENEEEQLSATSLTQRDIFHEGIDAVLQRVGDVWRWSLSAEHSAAAASVRKSLGMESGAPAAAPAQQPFPRLLVLNLHMVLDLYTPYICNSGRDTNSERASTQTTTAAFKMLPEISTTAVATAAFRVQEQHQSVVDHPWKCVAVHKARTDGATSQHFSAAVDLRHKETVEWLSTRMVVGEANLGDAASRSLFFNDSEARIQPLVCTFRARRSAAAAAAAAMQAGWRLFAGVVHARTRRAALMCRAGMLRTAQDAVDRCVGLASADRVFSQCSRAEIKNFVGGDVCDIDPNVYWLQRMACLHQRVFECVFGTQPVSSTAPAPTDMNQDSPTTTTESAATPSFDLERQTRKRLEVMRCEDVAQLLRLLLKKSDKTTETSSVPESAEADTRAVDRKLLHVRVLIDTLTELLPSASKHEVLRVTQDLLQLYADLLDASFEASSNGNFTNTDDGTSARHVVYEIRRLLSSVGVLLANDAERFEKGQLVWLLSRLHTPRLRGRVELTTEENSEGATAENRDVTARHTSAPAGTNSDMMLDVSESFVSAAVASTLIVSLSSESVLADTPAAAAAAGTQLATDELNVKANAEAGKGPVTVNQWLAVVSAAELKPSLETITALLKLIETSAL